MQDHPGSVWDKVSAVSFLNLICFGSFYLSSVFVTELSPVVDVAHRKPALLADFLAFFVGFLARPLGGLWFGVRGDLAGSRKAIKESLILLIVTTALMGVLPSAPSTDDLFFILLRCFQGLGLGGAYAAMAVYLYESAPEGKKARFTSWIQFSVAVGYITALLGVLMLKTIYAQEFYVQGGWRVAFFLPLVGLFFLGPFDEKRSPKIPASAYGEWLRSSLGTVKKQWSVWAPYLIVTMGIGVLSFTLSTYKFFFMKAILKMDPMTVDFASGISTILYLPFYYLGGRWADRFGGFKVCWIAVALGTLLMYPAFRVLEWGSAQSSAQILWIVLPVTGLGVILVLGFSGLIAMLCDLFPEKMRCTLFALSYGALGLLGNMAHGYGIHSFVQHGFRYSGIYVTVGVAALSVLGSAYFFFRPSQTR